MGKGKHESPYRLPEPLSEQEQAVIFQPQHLTASGCAAIARKVVGAPGLSSKELASHTAGERCGHKACVLAHIVELPQKQLKVWPAHPCKIVHYQYRRWHRLFEARWVS